MSNGLTLRDYQAGALRTDKTRDDDEIKSMIVPLLGLASESGSLLGEYKKWLREGDRYKPFTDQVSEELGDLLWYIAAIADRAGLDLQDVADENLAKLADRWPPTDDNRPLFSSEPERYDASYPESERLPLQFRVEFREVEVDADKKLQLTVNGEQYGDPLNDNSHYDDGYRFHDVFHFTYATLLGWSPIVRKLLDLKRRSVPQVDEVEDGARADRTEEAISAAIFACASDYSFFKDAEKVDYELLRMVNLLTRPFEVRDRTARDWENAILQSYRVWREMVANNGGVLVGDAAPQTVAYEPISGLPISSGS